MLWYINCAKTHPGGACFIFLLATIAHFKGSGNETSVEVDNLSESDGVNLSAPKTVTENRRVNSLQ